MDQIESLIKLAEKPPATISIVIGFIILGLFIWAIKNDRVPISHTVWKLTPIVILMFIFGPFVSPFFESLARRPVTSTPAATATPITVAAPKPQPTPAPVPGGAAKPTAAAPTAAKPTVATSSPDCILTIANPFVDLKREASHSSVSLSTVKPGQYRSKGYTEVSWAGRMEGWYQIDADGRTGWIVSNTITIQTRTGPCLP